MKKPDPYKVAARNRRSIGHGLDHPKFPEMGPEHNRPYLCEFPDGIPANMSVFDIRSDPKCSKCVLMARVAASKLGYPPEYLDTVIEESLKP